MVDPQLSDEKLAQGSLRTKNIKVCPAEVKFSLVAPELELKGSIRNANEQQDC